MFNTFFEKPLFGKNIEIIVYGIDKYLAESILEDAYTKALRLQKIFNFFDDSSELSKLNKERSLKVSNELLKVINIALIYCKETNGEYDITLGKQIIQRKNSEEVTPVACSFRDIQIKNNLFLK